MNFINNNYNKLIYQSRYYENHSENIKAMPIFFFFFFFVVREKIKQTEKKNTNLLELTSLIFHKEKICFVFLKSFHFYTR